MKLTTKQAADVLLCNRADYPLCIEDLQLAQLGMANSAWLSPAGKAHLKQTAELLCDPHYVAQTVQGIEAFTFDEDFQLCFKEEGFMHLDEPTILYSLLARHYLLGIQELCQYLEGKNQKCFYRKYFYSSEYREHQREKLNKACGGCTIEFTRVQLEDKIDAFGYPHFVAFYPGKISMMDFLKTAEWEDYLERYGSPEFDFDERILLTHWAYGSGSNGVRDANEKELEIITGCYWFMDGSFHFTKLGSETYEANL